MAASSLLEARQGERREDPQGRHHGNQDRPQERSKLSRPPCKGESGERSDERNTAE